MLKFLPCLFAGGCVAGATTGIVYSNSSMSKEEIKQTHFEIKLASTAKCVLVKLGHTKEHKYGKIYMCVASPERVADGLIPLYYLEEGAIERFDDSTENPLTLMKRIITFKQEKSEDGSAAAYLSINLGGGDNRRMPVYNSPEYSSWELFSGFEGKQ